MSSRSVSAGP